MVDLLRAAAPIALGALGETVNQRAGVINIGLEGMMLTGGFCAMLVTRQTGNPWWGLLAGIAAGLVMAVVSAWFILEQAVDQVVVGTAINLAALGITGTLYRQIFGQSGQLLSLLGLPRGPFGIDPVLIFLVFATVALVYLLFKSRWGLALRAAGEYPDAVQANGFSVLRIRWQAHLIGGAFAGLAGAYLCVGVVNSFAENFTNGRGFIALAMVTFGRFHPVWTFAASLVIVFADIFQFQLQARGIQVPPQLFLALPYLIALGVLVVVGKGVRVPQALAVPFRREKG